MANRIKPDHEKYTPLNVSMTPELKARLQAYCAERGLKPSRLIVEMIRKKLAKVG